MARSEKERKGEEKKTKKHKKKESKKEDESNAGKPLFPLLADDTRIDPTLSSLFATKVGLRFYDKTLYSIDLFVVSTSHSSKRRSSSRSQSLITRLERRRKCRPTNRRLT